MRRIGRRTRNCEDTAERGGRLQQLAIRQQSYQGARERTVKCVRGAMRGRGCLLCKARALRSSAAAVSAFGIERGEQRVASCPMQSCSSHSRRQRAD